MIFPLSYHFLHFHLFVQLMFVFGIEIVFVFVFGIEIVVERFGESVEQ